jgi:hypothetical protein
VSRDRSRPWQNPTPLSGFVPEWLGQFDTFDDWRSPDDDLPDDPPEQFFECSECAGEGIIREGFYSHDCGYDVDEKPCRACNGAGGYIDEAEGVRS